MYQIDNAILNYIYNNFHSSFLDYFLTLLSSLGNGKFIWSAVAYLLILQKKTRKCGILLTIGLIASSLLGEEILKPLVARDRPFYHAPHITLLIKRPWGYSFPSGHTMDSFVCATLLYRYNKSFGTIALITAFLMGFSRIYLYVHYPSDVLAGAILGIVLGNFIYKYSSLSKE